jgi:hypothetical protein
MTIRLVYNSKACCLKPRRRFYLFIFKCRDVRLFGVKLVSIFFLDFCGDLTTEICEMICLFIFKETLVNNNNVHSLDYNNCMDSHVCNNNQDECSADMQNYL